MYVLQQVFQRNMEIIAVLLVGGVDAVINRNKADTVGGKYRPKVQALANPQLILPETISFIISWKAGRSNRTPL